MSSIFDSIFATVDTMSPQEFMICIVASLVMGFLISGIYMFRNKHTDSFALTIALLPAIVCVVIMAVSGDIGAGIAVAGAFSLVRFRSAPGSAKEIVVIFLTMAVGLLVGMGFIAYAAVFGTVIGLVIFACTTMNFGVSKAGDSNKVVRITIPEDLDYNSEIDAVIAEHCTTYELTEVKTVNMGSMFRLTYRVVMKDPGSQKELIDKIRVRNGNLEVAVLREETVRAGL